MTKKSREEKNKLVKQNKDFFEKLTFLMDDYSSKKNHLYFGMDEIKTNKKTKAEYDGLFTINEEKINLEVSLNDFKLKIDINNGKKNISILKDSKEIANWQGELESLFSFLNAGNLSINDNALLEDGIKTLTPVLDKYFKGSINIPETRTQNFTNRLTQIPYGFSNLKDGKYELTPEGFNPIKAKVKHGIAEIEMEFDDFKIDMYVGIKGTLVNVSKDEKLIAKWADQRFQLPSMNYNESSDVVIYDVDNFSKSIDVFTEMALKCKELKIPENKEKTKSKLRVR